MSKLNLAIIYGGTSPEREVSLASGKAAIEALDTSRYNLFEYDPKEGLGKLVANAPTLDVALILLHGSPGEDGTVQGLLDLLKIPYQGAGVLGSAIAMDKPLSKTLYKEAGIPTPKAAYIHKGDVVNAFDITQDLGLPLFVKPACGGSSVGMSRVTSTQELEDAIALAHTYDELVIVESFIDGIELTCGVLGNTELEALPIIEIIPEGESTFFDYTAKYTPGATTEICPARIEKSVSDRVMHLAQKAHKALHLKGYSRTDFILKRDGNLFALETNTIPGMTSTSLLPRAARTAGYTFTTLLDRLIELALEG
ncbi:MAG: D-alanine--D-alanine ligase [Desulfobacterales bacterium]|nr:D-alanine--D-alanine ligase [Desulfobacterales bacterium]